MPLAGCLAVSVLQRGHAEMIFHVFTKVRGVGKCELVAYLLDAEICLTQIVTDVLQYLFCNPFEDRGDR